MRIYKAKKAYETLSGVESHCLIDRDYRTDTEIVALKNDGVNFLDVAEVENLFVVPSLLDIMEKQLGCNVGSAKNAEDFIIGLFNSNKPNQIKESFLKEEREVKRIKGEHNALHYIGIAADEAGRCKTEQYPLVEWGITEAEALQICYDRGFDFGGLYRIYHRACLPYSEPSAYVVLR